MSKLEKFAYNLGAAMVEVNDFVKPKFNWVIPFVIGMVVCYYL